MPKIVKLDKRHTLHSEGFTHALRYDMWDVQRQEIENALTKMFGSQYRKYPKWGTRFGTRSKKTKHLVYWIAVKNESVFTLLMLQGIINYELI